MKTEGWETLSVSMGMDRAVRSFQDFCGNTANLNEIRPGQALAGCCSTKKPIVTGYIDSVRSSYAKGSHTTNIAGRSPRRPISWIVRFHVSCGHSLSTKQHDHPTLAQLANTMGRARLASMFVFTQRMPTTLLQRIENYAPEPGVRVFEAISEFLA